MAKYAKHTHQEWLAFTAYFSMTTSPKPISQIKPKSTISNIWYINYAKQKIKKLPILIEPKMPIYITSSIYVHNAYVFAKYYSAHGK